MRRRDPELEELLAPLRDGPVALSSANDAAAQRVRLLPRVRQAVRGVPDRMAAHSRRQAAVWLGSCAVAAAALLAIGLARGRLAEGELAQAGILQLEPGTGAAAWIAADGGERSIDGGALEGSGELVASAGSWSRLSTPQGVKVELAPRTRLRVREAARDQRSAQLNLVEGEVHCQVPKLGKRAQFSIATPDANVIVHGTRFSVHVGGPAQPGTCVRVSEGLVEVRHGGQSTFLPPGTQWGCAPEVASRGPELAQVARPSSARTTTVVQTVASLPQVASSSATVKQPFARAEAAPSVTPARRAAVRRAARAAARAARVADARASSRADDAAAQAARASGTLGEENRLLAAGLAAERNRNFGLASELFEQLLGRNPDSPLAPEARAGLTRVR